MGEKFVSIDASEWFLHGLERKSDPEAKRRVIGETFIRVLRIMPAAWEKSAFWCRAPFTRMLWNPVPRTEIKQRGLRLIIM